MKKEQVTQRRLDADVMLRIDSLIKKWDEKRIELLHFRRTGPIPGGWEQSQMIDKMLADLEELRGIHKFIERTLDTLAQHFDAFAVALSTPMTDEEREAMYAQANLSAEICRKARGQGGA